MGRYRVLELYYGLLPDREWNSPLGSDLMKGIISSKQVEQLFETPARRLKDFWILGSCSCHDLVDLISRDTLHDAAGQQGSGAGIHVL